MVQGKEGHLEHGAGWVSQRRGGGKGGKQQEEEAGFSHGLDEQVREGRASGVLSAEMTEQSRPRPR